MMAVMSKATLSITAANWKYATSSFCWANQNTHFLTKTGERRERTIFFMRGSRSTHSSLSSRISTTPTAGSPSTDISSTSLCYHNKSRTTVLTERISSIEYTKYGKYMSFVTCKLWRGTVDFRVGERRLVVGIMRAVLSLNY